MISMNSEMPKTDIAIKILKRRNLITTSLSCIVSESKYQRY